MRKSWTGCHCLVFYKDLRIRIIGIIILRIIGILRFLRLEVLEVSVVSTLGLNLEVPRTI